LVEERRNLDIRPFEASEPLKAKGEHSFLRFNQRNPEQKNENFILAGFFKDPSNANNNSKTRTYDLFHC